MSSSRTLEPIYVVDTHTLIWALTDDKQLSPLAKSIFDAAKQDGQPELVISAVVIAEMYYANVKRSLFEDFIQTYAELAARPYVRLVPFGPDEVLDFDQDAAISEMHDRIIVGLARRLDAPLLTSDRQITAAKVVPVVW